MSGHTLRGSAWSPLHVSCLCAVVVVPGESAGPALVMLTEGAALQRLQDPLAPVSPVLQTDWEHLGSVSASGPCRLRSV